MKLLEIRRLWQAGSGSDSLFRAEWGVYKNSHNMYQAWLLIRRVLDGIYAGYYLQSGASTWNMKENLYSLFSKVVYECSVLTVELGCFASCDIEIALLLYSVS